MYSHLTFNRYVFQFFYYSESVTYNKNIPDIMVVNNKIIP